MYCLKCGEQLPNDSLFCSKCGNQLNSIATNQNQTNILSDTYNRDVIIQHLTSIRFLEFSRSKLEKALNEKNNQINSLAIQHNISKPSVSGSDIDWEVVGYAIAFAIAIPIIAAIVNIPIHWLSGSNIVRTLGFIISAFIIIGCLIYMIVTFINDSKLHASNQLKYDEDIKEEAERMKTESIKKETANNEYAQIYAEYEKADELLNKAYSVNIIPNQFRNIYAAYYLYEFMSSSNQSFEEALLHCNLEAIKQELNLIYAQQEQIIINQSLMLAQNEQLLINQEKTMEVAIQNEHNTKKAAQYAEVAANNTEAIAWISVANYIKN